ncbi:hypothetical protein PN419_00480 [Halorubrum ezzemoulense]|uniref:hypothetical protein n=1 Tax=Halorubrum ezzemoulense TaxID=337243 RepID=UPI00232C21D8|nr:hypothetical protein [Halorubrum ezzemoulense]MDB9247483.1 hypothetical protein [Halorubrum ezzemoulense]MDB9258608.1 hypothetical protein [Halorubrum ezzemoulense]MDB9264533.1 hypothetical protein [Halorubrum ezzemoulense]MDB9268969.1 hypothetical protein [Halorubrum ezzemoulense]MDB9271501.1 hypothetical protein [Halorubrum ezzemoulense]
MSLLCWLFGHRDDTKRIATVEFNYRGEGRLSVDTEPVYRIESTCQRCGKRTVETEPRDT